MEQENGRDRPNTTYTVTATFSVGSPPDERLQDERAIRDEVEGWLESLKATVVTVTVKLADEGRMK